MEARDDRGRGGRRRNERGREGETREEFRIIPPEPGIAEPYKSGLR